MHRIQIQGWLQNLKTISKYFVTIKNQTFSRMFPRFSTSAENIQVQSSNIKKSKGGEDF